VEATPLAPSAVPSPEKKGEMDVGLAPEGKVTSPITDEWLNCVVSIEVTGKKQPTPVGTGFLVVSEKEHVILVSAKHVVVGETDREFESHPLRSSFG